MTRSRVAVLISGRGSNMAALIYAARAADCPYEVALVTSDRADAPGLDLAAAEGITVERLPYAKATFFHQLGALLSDRAIDVIALAGFMRILPPEFVARWAGRIVNIHPSLLPRHKGLRPHDAVLAAGEKRTGATVHLVSAEVDSGEILGQVDVAVLPADDAAALATRVLVAEHQLYPRVLAQYVSRERDPDWLLARIGGIALALPETRAKTSHGAPGWKVGSPSSDRFFALMWLGRLGEGGTSVLVKVSGQEEMATLIEADPDRYFRPAYYGPADWIGLRLDRRPVDWDHVADWLARSWRTCASPRLTRLLDAADEI